MGRNKAGFEGYSSKNAMVLFDGKKVDFWRHNWAGNRSIQEALNLTDDAIRGCKVNLKEFCKGVLTWPGYIIEFLAKAGLGMVNIYEAEHRDTLHWLPDINGEFTVASAYNKIRRKGSVKWWQGYVWNNYIHPRTAGTAWKLINKIAVTYENMVRRGFRIVSRCVFYHTQEETLNHILWNCKFGCKIWKWIARMFGVGFKF